MLKVPLNPKQTNVLNQSHSPNSSLTDTTRHVEMISFAFNGERKVMDGTAGENKDGSVQYVMKK